MDFGLIRKSGLRQHEFATLCGVSRTTVNLWVTGKMKPHRLLQDTVNRVMVAIAKGVEDKRLPTKSSTITPRMVVVEILEELASEATVS